MDRNLRNALVIQYLPLVRHVADRLWRSPCRSILRRSLGAFEDALQVGYVALIQAASHYRAGHASGASFKTYAYQTIQRAILTQARRSLLIAIPEHLQQPGAAKAWPRQMPYVATATRIVSLSLCPENVSVRRQQPENACLREALDRLPAYYRKLLESRFGLTGARRKTYREIASAQHITCRIVMYRCVKALRMLRAEFLALTE